MEMKITFSGFFGNSSLMCSLCHFQDLVSQVSAEMDPVSLLAKVVSLIYVQVS